MIPLDGNTHLSRVAIMTGSRAEYGLLTPVIRALAERVEISVLVAGQHLLSTFGETWREIESDGWPIGGHIRMSTEAGDDHRTMAHAIGNGVSGCADALDRINADAVVVLGDRVEAFAAAVAGAALGCVVAHIHGGEITRGGLDESMRHAITKLAHLHFVATPMSRERLLRMGEPPDRIIVSGAPGLDSILTATVADRSEVEAALGHPLRAPLIVLVQHPVTTTADHGADEMRESLEALKALALPTVALYPNSDAGGRRMIAVLESYAAEPWLTVKRHLTHALYLRLLREADVLVGNSSSGLIEAPSLALPAVNIGSRQHGRERGDNVIDVPSARAAIAAAVRRALADQEFRATVARRRNPYGDGRASDRIADAIARLELTPTFVQKQFWEAQEEPHGR